MNVGSGGRGLSAATANGAGRRRRAWLLLDGRRSAVLAAGALDETCTPTTSLLPTWDTGCSSRVGGWSGRPKPMLLHAGGITVNACADPAQALALSQAAMAEARHMRNRWLSFAGEHPLWQASFEV